MSFTLRIRSLSGACQKGLLLAIACTANLYAQTNMGTITGLVTDRSTAVLPGVTVTAKNMATGAEAVTLTSSTGNYLIPNLPVGPYLISVSHPGFKTWSRAGLSLSAGENIRAD